MSKVYSDIVGAVATLHNKLNSAGMRGPFLVELVTSDADVLEALLPDPRLVRKHVNVRYCELAGVLFELNDKD